MRVWMILASLTLLCACQQAGNGPAAKQPSTIYSSQDGKPSYFEPEVEALMSQIGDKLASGCLTQAEAPGKLNSCIRDNFADAFDDSGMGRKSCDFHTSLADYLSCVAIGNTLIELRHRLSDDSPVPAGFWSDDTAMSDALISSVVKRGFDACGTSGESGPIKDCLATWFEQRLALPPSMLDRCKAHAPDDDREKCWGEAFMVRFLQDHVPRLGAINT